MRFASAEQRERIIEEHLPLVRRCALRFVRRGEELDDLVQVGSIGLICALDRFEPARGATLAAYLEPCIVGEIRRHLRDRACPVRVPRRTQLERARLARVEREELARSGRSPSLRTLARRAGVDEARVGSVQASGLGAVPLASEPAVGCACPVADDRWGMVDDRLTVGAALRGLPARQRAILERRFIHDRTQGEIAREFGISQVQVSRTLTSALASLRRELDDRVVVQGGLKA